MVHKTYKSWGFRAEEIILGGIILLNILDFFEVLSPGGDYIKKVVSWVALGYLLYQASPTEVLFGKKNKLFDFSLIIGFFSMIVKNLIGFAVSAREEIINNAPSYLQFVKGGVAEQIKINVSNATMTTIQTVGGIPGASEMMKSYASKLTLFKTSIGFSFVSGTGTESFKLIASGFDGFVLQLYNTLIKHSFLLERWGFFIGGGVMLLITLYMTFFSEIKSPSVLAVLHEEGSAPGWSKILRCVLVFAVLSAFFVLVFNLMMEWLAIAIDAPLLMLGLAGTVLLLLRGAEMELDNWLSSVGNFGEGFYKKFIGLFHTKHRILLGLSGLLVLHLLTDVGNFMIPYLVGFHDAIYFGTLGPGHHSLLALISSSFSPSILATLSFLALYLLNYSALLLLLVLPGYIWYKIFKMRHSSFEEMHYPDFSPFFLAFFFSSLTAFLTAPVYTLKGLKSGSLVGVDITSAPLSIAPVKAEVILLLSLSVFGVVFFLGLFERVKKYLTLILLLSSVIFLGFYAWLYFISTFKYYLSQITSLFQENFFVLSFFFLLFLLINALFYISGFLIFIYEIWRE